MNNEAVNQSLIDIEENLRKLDSARNQVDNVAEKSQQLVTEVSNLVREIQVLKNEFDSESNSFNSDFSKVIREFETNLKNQTETLLKRSNSITSEYSKNTDKNIEHLISFQENIEIAKSKLSKLDFQSGFSKLQLGQDKIYESNDLSKLEIFERLDDLRLKIETCKANIIENHDVSNKKLNDSFISFINEFTDYQKSINQETKRLFNIQNNRLLFNQKILFGILLLGFLGVLTTYFLSK